MLFPTKWLTKFFTVFYTKFQNTHHFNYANLLFLWSSRDSTKCFCLWLFALSFCSSIKENKSVENHAVWKVCYCFPVQRSKCCNQKGLLLVSQPLLYNRKPVMKRVGDSVVECAYQIWVQLNNKSMLLFAPFTPSFKDRQKIQVRTYVNSTNIPSRKQIKEVMLIFIVGIEVQ